MSILNAIARPHVCLARFFAAAAVLVLLTASPARAIDIKVVKSPGGITAWLIEDATVPLMSMQFLFRGGSVLDPEGKTGLAELVSGVLDEGAGPYSSAQFQRRLEDNSISLRFNATLESFGGSLKALNENRDEAIELLRLALTAPRFDNEPVARVKSQMLAEVKRRAERPRNIAGRAWNKAIFIDHPYGRDTDGTKTSIPAITQDDLRQFVKTRLGRDNLIVGVVGDVSPAQLVPLLDRAFGDLPAKAASYTVLPAKVVGAGKVIVVERNIPQTVVIFGQAGLRRDDPDYYVASVMNYIMGGGGLTSRLADEIREKRGLAYSVYTRLTSYDNAGLIVGQVATQNARVAQSLELIRAEWTRMATMPVSQKELDDAKSYLTGSYFTRLNSTRRIAGLLVGIQFDNLGIDYLKRRNDLINVVTVSDIQRVARRLLKPDALTVVMVGKPKGITARP
jgi:zinc protease